MTVFAATEEGSPLVTYVVPLDRSSVKSRVGDFTVSIATKWEGAALLVNAIVSGPEDYSIDDRWTRSRDGNKLTIERNVVRRTGETESVLTYRVAGDAQPFVSENSARSGPAAPAGQAAAPSVSRLRSPAPPQASDYVLASGTRILLRLTNAVDTKHSSPGDHVYLQTAAPVFLNGRLVIPQGSYVTGSITEAQRAGRVKGKSALNLRFETITLPNGVVRDLLSRAGSVDTRGNLDRTEGRIEGESNKGGDARTVATTTAAGTGVGAIAGSAAGHLGMGAGIGAAAGAAAGLAGIFGSRGPDVVLRPGTTMELVLDRDLTFTSDELNRIR
jgi:type IV secretion system protein VirB10